MNPDIARKVHVGASGWSYKDWVGPFYPPGTPPREYLERYAEHFTTVEVDSTFYAIPAQRTVESWAERTGDAFRFALKVPSIVTHGAAGERPRLARVLADDAHLDVFLEVVEPLKAKIASLLFQFPYFRVREMSPAEFMPRLARTLGRLPHDYRFAVEIRNKSWITPEYLSLLSEHRVAAVLIDHPYMPPPARQLAAGMVTTDFAYIRLLGNRHAIERKTKQWGETVEDRSVEIERWAEMVEEIAARPGVGDIYAFSNNHFAGHAPETCRRLLRSFRLLDGPM